MSFSIPELLALEHPGVEGISTRESVIIAWPSDIGVQPNAAKITALRAKWNPQENNIRALVGINSQKSIVALRNALAGRLGVPDNVLETEHRDEFKLLP